MATAAKLIRNKLARDRVRKMVWDHINARPCKDCGKTIKPDAGSGGSSLDRRVFLKNGERISPSVIIQRVPGYRTLETILGEMEVQCRYCYRKERGYRSRDHQAKQRIRVKQKIRALCLKSMGCRVCGEAEPIALDFHHLDPAQKDGSPLRQSSVKRALAEAAKCVILCANCHRKVHAGLIVLPLTFPTP